MGRKIGAVFAGMLMWAVLWIGGSTVASVLFPDLLAPGMRVTHAGALAGYLLWSVIISVAAGWLTARLSLGSTRAVYWLAAVQLFLGIGFEATSWNLTPVWYHVAFLLLLVPAIVYGGSLWRSSASSITIPAS